MKFFGKIIITGFFLGVLLVAFPANSFSISPLKYSATISEGESQEFKVSIINDGQEDKIFSASVVGIKQDQLGRPFFEKNIDVAENWVKINNPIKSLARGESGDFIFSIKVPANTPPGAHYLGLSVQENNNENIGTRLAVILTLQVAGIANESLRVDYFGFEKKYFFDNNWTGFLNIKNTGNVDLNIVGKVVLFGPKSQIIPQEINFGNKIFSQSIRQIKINSFDDQIFAIPGKYKVKININYGLTNQQTSVEAGFWYFPKWFLIASSVIFLLLVILLFIKIRKKKHVIPSV